MSNELYKLNIEVFQMNIIDKKIIQNTVFSINPCLEFACALRLAGKKEMLLNFARELSFAISEKDEEIFQAMEKEMSKYIRNELDYFFGICEIHVLVAAFVADYPQMDSVTDIIKCMEGETEAVLLTYLGAIFISEHVSKFDESWDEIKNDISKMRTYIETVEVEHQTSKEGLLECFDNPEETKQRICFLLKQFYEKAYKPIEQQTLQEIKKSETGYKNLFEANPRVFMEKYFSDFFKLENSQWDYKLNIHISFFYQIYFWTINIHDYKQRAGWCILGIRSYEFLFKREAKDRVERFLKVLSDKRRVEIIKLLSHKPYYGYEIAAKLNLTPATVGYHISFLMEANIISFDREENKVYYTLNKDKVRELLEETGIILLGE